MSTRNPNFYHLLLHIDQDLAEQTRAQRCRCGGVLNSTRYSRKLPDETRSHFDFRYSFFCADCRCHTTPFSAGGSTAPRRQRHACQCRYSRGDAPTRYAGRTALDDRAMRALVDDRLRQHAILDARTGDVRAACRDRTDARQPA